MFEVTDCVYGKCLSASELSGPGFDSGRLCECVKAVIDCVCAWLSDP